MPTCRRKRVVLTEPDQALLDPDARTLNKHVYYLAQTGEIFQTYDAYAARMSFYRTRQFQCEVTGKSNLTYFEALESEMQEARTMHSRFPEPLKSSILKAVQWQVVGRLDHLVDAVYERFKDRYFPEERALVDVQGDKYFARIAHVFPPRANAASTSTAQTLDGRIPLHVIGGDLKIPIKEAFEKDDPTKYLYQIQIIDEERSSDSKLSAKDREARETNRAKWSASLMEVSCSALSRDRLAFSKSILRRFIRDCVDRDAALASPWVVKPSLAERYGVSTVMPDEIRKGVESIRQGEVEKRRKVWEDKEGPPSKKQKKLDEKAAALALAAEIREREGDKAKEEAERAAAEKKKKKPIRYPTEDLDVKLTDREIKAGALLRRPIPRRATLPFGEDPRTFESFLMTWSFLVTYSHTLHLSSITLDDFEHALRHSVDNPPCALLSEVHAALIYNLRTVPFNRHNAVMSLLHHKSNEPVSIDGDEIMDEESLGVSIDQLTATMADAGNNWERVALRHTEGREGWEDALLGCLKDHADLEKFPRLRQVLTRLLFAPAQDGEDGTSSTSSGSSRGTPMVLSVPSKPAERYYALPPRDRIEILAFMCDIAVSSKAIHTHMETSEEQLTALRKEKIEVNRTKKQHLEDLSSLTGEGEKTNGDAPPVPDSSDLSDAPSDSENASESGAKAKNGRRKAGANATQRAAARASAKSAKQAAAEQRRLEEELNKLDRRLEGIEREFRKLLGGVRARPLGKDRFYNRVWWLDGLGGASLIGSGGSVLYGTGRIFLQGPSEFDVEMLKRREKEEGDVEKRRNEEEGPQDRLGVGEWAVYEDIEEVNAFMTWLNPKGVRELALKNTMTKWWTHIGPGIRKRQADLDVQAKIPDARRSSRVRTGPNSDIAREPYMLWTNRRAVSAA